MKKLLLGVAFSAFSFYAMGQSPMPAVKEAHNSLKGEKAVLYDKGTTNLQPLGKKSDVAAWYNWMDAAENFGVTFTSYRNNFIFPDSTVKISYGDGAGGTVLGWVGRHLVGQTFDPKAFYFDADSFSRYTTYRWDSLRFYYQYAYKIDTAKRNMPKPDRVVIQYLSSAQSNGILFGTLQNDGDKTAWIRYDRTRNRALNSIKTDTLELTIDDTISVGGYRAISVPVGINVPANGIVAFALTYLPGYDYDFGDTLDWVWNNPAPSNPMNSFIPYQVFDNSKLTDESYNNGLSVPTNVRYGLASGASWAGYAIPGDAWLTYTSYTYASFHVTSSNVGINEFGSFNSELNLYPNPAHGEAQLLFSLSKADNVAVSVRDIAGKEISTAYNGTMGAGKQRVAINTENMKPGMYLCTVKAGAATKTIKFMVTK